METTIILGVLLALCLLALVILALRGGRPDNSLARSVSDTTRHLGALAERLKVIDQAQANISSLTTQILTLQQVLSDKQSRGAFGEERLQVILDDQLAGLYEWQPTLSNGARPDCLIKIAKDNPPLVVDSKFPLEAYEQLRLAADDQARRSAASAFRNDVMKHVKDIARKYLIAGETQPIALMFVASEAVFAELRGSIPEVLHGARKDGVVIVSPHIFMLAVNMIQGLVKDAKMRQHADKIRAAVLAMMGDVRRLEERVGKLRGHFDGMQKDVGEIETSLKKISGAADRIEAVEIDLESSADGPPSSQS